MSGGGGGGSLVSLGVLLLIPVAMYFLLIRPQRRRMRAQQALQSSLDVGDEVITTSGIYGFITGFEDDKVWIEIDDDVQIRINRGFLQGKVDTSGLSAPAAGANGRSSSGASGASDRPSGSGGELPAPKVTPTVKGRKAGNTDAAATTADTTAESNSGE